MLAMQCPKCGAEGEAEASECSSCGVLFAKVRPREERPVAVEAGESTAASEPRHWVDRLGAMLLPEPEPTSMAVLVVRAVFLVILATWSASFMLAGPRSPALGASFLHLIHLVFHEAGHVVFMPFGRFLMVLGGALLQVSVPVVFVVYFVRWRDDVYAASVCTFWTGQSLMDLAPYVSDARALDLVLLGGRTGKEVEGHDFEYLLTATGLLQWDIALGRLVFLAGSLVVVAGLAWGGANLWRQRQRIAA